MEREEKPKSPVVGAAATVELTPSRIDAMIRLLGDDDPKIRGVVREHLTRDIDVTRPYLEDRRRQDDDPRVRREAALLLTNLARVEKLRLWEEFGRQLGPLDLETGAFLICEVEHPETDFLEYRETLHSYGQVLAGRLSLARQPDAVVSKLKHLLFRELGFRGNREEYYDPRNSFLHSVIDRKLGIPITLSAVCMLVASRVGLRLDGIGMPGHFIVRYRSQRRDKYFDPFKAGQPWSLEDCRQHLRSEGYAAGELEEHLRPCTVRQTLTRMLQNLLSIYRNEDDDVRTQRIESMLMALNPRT